MNENLNLVEILKENPIGAKVGKLKILREIERATHPNGRTSRRFEANFCVCVSGSVDYCVPYNDDTKHLVGTTDEAPEYYRYWEE